MAAGQALGRTWALYGLMTAALSAPDLMPGTWRIMCLLGGGRRALRCEGLGSKASKGELGPVVIGPGAS